MLTPSVQTALKLRSLAGVVAAHLVAKFDLEGNTEVEEGSVSPRQKAG